MNQLMGDPTVKFFYREAVNLVVGEEYCLKGISHGVIVSILRKDGRVVDRIGSRVRSSTVKEMSVRLPNGSTMLCCPEDVPEQPFRKELAGNQGIWIRR